MSTYTAKHKAYYEANKERILSLRKEREIRWMATPRGKYSVQKRKAKQRGIDWEFTFETWWNKWEQSGLWENRGDTQDASVMSRYGDVGPYAVDNTYINTMSGNSREVYIRNGIDALGRMKPQNKDLS